MRVAYVAPSLDDTTGWGRWVNDFLRHMQLTGVEPVVLAPPSARQHWQKLVPDADVHFVLPELFDYAQSSTGLLRLWAGKAFWRFSVPGSIQLVHSLDAHPWGIYGDRLARRAGAPHVMTTHGRYGYIARDRALDRSLYAGVLRRTRTMVAVSDAVRRAVLDSFPGEISADRVVAMQNPVDGHQFTTAGALPSDVPRSGPVIVSVTRFIPVKDLVTAVRAFARVRTQVPEATYFIIGPGHGPSNQYCQQVRAIIANERIDGVHIVGRVGKDVLSAFYRRAALLMHTAQTLPDDFEASGLILLEAGLFGLPVVASASGGIPEVVEDGVTGRLVPERDAVALGEAVTELLRNPEVLTRLGEGNARRARERDWTSYCAAQAQLYHRLQS